MAAAAATRGKNPPSVAKKQAKKQKKKLNLVGLIPWLLSMSLLGMVMSLYLISSVVGAETEALQNQISVLDEVLQSEPEADPEEESLFNTLLEAQTQLDAMETLLDEMQQGFINWPQMMAVFNNYDRAQMSVDGILQNEQHLIISGKTTEETHVLLYLDLLEVTGLFADVAISKISLRNAEAPMPVEYEIIVDFIQQEATNDD